ILGILKKGTDPDERYAAALVLAEHGDARGEGELLARWTRMFGPDAKSPGELDDAREMLDAFAALHARNGAPVLVRSLDEVRLRPYIVNVLAELGDHRAKDPLLKVFAEERYVHIRAPEARALVKLGAREKLMPPLARFAGMPEPFTEAIRIARDVHLLT